MYLSMFLDREHDLIIIFQKNQAIGNDAGNCRWWLPATAASFSFGGQQTEDSAAAGNNKDRGLPVFSSVAAPSFSFYV